jgi:cation transport regulator
LDAELVSGKLYAFDAPRIDPHQIRFPKVEYFKGCLSAKYCGHGTEAMMPFQSVEDLPPSLRSRLPAHAQEIFRAAFNNAWATYVTSSPHEREELCHRIAWSAVKKKYYRLGNSWVSL